MTGAAASCVVWIVEDHRRLRRDLAEIIEGAEGLACGLAVGRCEEALAALEDGPPPDVVLMDLGLPGLGGVDGTRRVRSLSPATRVLVLTIHSEDEVVFEAISAGASGYLLKPSSPREIVRAILEVSRGGAPMNAYIAARILERFARLPGAFETPETDYRLTQREREILQLLVDGLTMKQIAERLGVSYHTVDAHLRNIYEKLHVRSRSTAVAKALREELI